MTAAGPTARSSHSFFELLERAANATLASFLLLGIFDPTDELVACERRDVFPSSERRRGRRQRRAQICRELVHHPA